jgi:hypothetical protein
MIMQLLMIFVKHQNILFSVYFHFVSTVADIFVDSFVVVEKCIYNKSIFNTLINIGLVNELGHCLIRRLVIN